MIKYFSNFRYIINSGDGCVQPQSSVDDHGGVEPVHGSCDTGGPPSGDASSLRRCVQRTRRVRRGYVEPDGGGLGLWHWPTTLQACVATKRRQINLLIFFNGLN